MPSIILDISLERETKETKPTESESEIGLSKEEILRIKKNRNNLEPIVYSRKNVPGRSKDQPIIPAHGQPKALGNGSLNASGNPYYVPAPIHTSSSPITDLSLPSHFDPSPEISAPKPSLGLAPIVLAQDLDLDLPIALRKGTRACSKHPIAKYISYSNLSHNYKTFTTNISKLVVPRNIQEALDEPSWKLVVFEEMNALKKNGTREVVDLPREKKVVGCKWVFTIKSKADGSVERYKARLVAKGFTQNLWDKLPRDFRPRS